VAGGSQIDLRAINRIDLNHPTINCSRAILREVRKKRSKTNKEGFIMALLNYNKKQESASFKEVEQRGVQVLRIGNNGRLQSVATIDEDPFFVFHQLDEALKVANSAFRIIILDWHTIILQASLREAGVADSERFNDKKGTGQAFDSNHLLFNDGWRLASTQETTV
jgi:hypothetical protein